jgi:hypothetical protein
MTSFNCYDFYLFIFFVSISEDMLTEDKGECVICLEELIQGNTIARLPCLCIYHKRCGSANYLLLN